MTVNPRTITGSPVSEHGREVGILFLKLDGEELIVSISREALSRFIEAETIGRGPGDTPTISIRWNPRA